jgi:hypothetical protein
MTIILGRLRWDAPPINFGLGVYPTATQMQDVASGEGKGSAIKLNKKWYDYWRKLNGEEEYNLLVTTGRLLFNTKNNPTMMEKITSEGNVIAIDKIANNHARVLSCYGNSETPPSDIVTYQENSIWTHIETCLTYPTGKIRKPGRGLDVFFTMVNKQTIFGITPRWVHLSRVELFPILPFSILKADMTKAVIMNYICRGSEVYGIQADGKEIPLLIYKFGDAAPYYPTSWRMTTLPPLPPAL